MRMGSLEGGDFNRDQSQFPWWGTKHLFGVASWPVVIKGIATIGVYPLQDGLQKRMSWTVYGMRGNEMLFHTMGKIH